MFFWSKFFVLFLRRGMRRERRRRRREKNGRKKETSVSLPLSCFFSLSTNRNALFFSNHLAPEGSGHVGRADGGLGGQDGDLEKVFFEEGEDEVSESGRKKRVLSLSLSCFISAQKQKLFTL